MLAIDVAAIEAAIALTAVGEGERAALFLVEEGTAVGEGERAAIFLPVEGLRARGLFLEDALVLIDCRFRAGEGSAVVLLRFGAIAPTRT